MVLVYVHEKSGFGSAPSNMAGSGSTETFADWNHSNTKIKDLVLASHFFTLPKPPPPEVA